MTLSTPSTSFTIPSYMMQVTLPLGAGRVSAGASRVGRHGRDHIFFPKASAGSTFPPPKPTHLPPTLYFCPINWLTPLATPLRGKPNGPSERLGKCRAFVGTPRVGEIYLPHSPPRWHVLFGENQQAAKVRATHVQQSRVNRNRIRDTQKTGNVSRVDSHPIS